MPIRVSLCVIVLCHSFTSSLLLPPHMHKRMQVPLPGRRLCCLWMTSTCPSWTPTALSLQLNCCGSTWSALLAYSMHCTNYSSFIICDPHVVQCCVCVCMCVCCEADTGGCFWSCRTLVGCMTETNSFGRQFRCGRLAHFTVTTPIPRPHTYIRLAHVCALLLSSVLLPYRYIHTFIRTHTQHKTGCDHLCCVCPTGWRPQPCHPEIHPALQHVLPPLPIGYKPQDDFQG